MAYNSQNHSSKAKKVHFTLQRVGIAYFTPELCALFYSVHVKKCIILSLFWGWKRTSEDKTLLSPNKKVYFP